MVSATLTKTVHFAQIVTHQHGKTFRKIDCRHLGGVELEALCEPDGLLVLLVGWGPVRVEGGLILPHLLSHLVLEEEGAGPRVPVQR